MPDLPLICEVKGLRGVQFTNGAGRTLAEALPVFKQIQQLGMMQYIHVEYDDVEFVMQELNHEGLFIFTAAPTVETADMLIKNVEKLFVCRTDLLKRVDTS